MTGKFKYDAPANIRAPKKRAYLKAFAACGGYMRACRAAGIHHSTYYDWLDKDKDFRDAMAELKEEYIEWLEAVADERATRKTRPSDILMIVRLKALRPEVYRERHDVKVSEAEVDREIERLLASRGGVVASPPVSDNGHANGNGHAM